MTEDTTLGDSTFEPSASAAPPEVLGLVIVWSAHPAECGRVILIPPLPVGHFHLIGRGEDNPSDGRTRLFPEELRPGGSRRPEPLTSPKISRAQLCLELLGNGTLSVSNIGKARMLHNNAPSQHAVLAVGDTLQLGNQLIMTCVRRAAWLRGMSDCFVPPAFGRGDAHGIVGESPAIWELRQQLAFAALQPEHVLVSGESGTGKELIANALHAGSSRAKRALIARNASTLPETLIDAELFGNAKNYPNPGTPERPGLFGLAHESTLFLDEIAELPAALQTHLLRVLDAGEYHRLGDAQARRTDIRLIGATNRPELLRPDLAARFRIRIHCPGFHERREDIPLLVHAALRTIAAQPTSNALRFFANGDLEQMPRVSRALILVLLRRGYTAHFRELEAILWKSVNASPGDTLELSVEVQAEATSLSLNEESSSAAVDPASLTREALEASLQRSNWVVEQAWRDLGLSSRHVLTRLMARHGLRRS